MRITLRVIVPDTVLPDEWYALGVQQDGIVLTATTEEGLYRGTRTLIQLLEQGQESATLPCLSILDAPASIGVACTSTCAATSSRWNS